jgi:hypothetical protein
VTGVSRYHQSRDIDQNQEVRPESGYTTGVGHTTEVASSNRSQAYDWSRIFRPESGYDRSRTYDRSRDIPHYKHI